ncbi:hypothetical protein RUM44_010557 [Polyplax serrata]|uniref:Uncharacterized protein n=1 Tax=Polyplax serrata TaxID=468196 RepID=A0ABR1AVV0_POLSC
MCCRFEFDSAKVVQLSSSVLSYSKKKPFLKRRLTIELPQKTVLFTTGRRVAVARKRLNLLKPQKSLIPPKGHLKKAKTSRQGILQEIERQQKSSDAVVETSFFLSPLKRHRNNFNNFMNNYTSERCLEFDSYRESAPNYFQLVLVTLVALFEELKYRYFLVVLQKNCTQTTIKSSQHFYCLQLYLTSNVSTADFNMGYSMTGTLERGYKSSNSFQMTHFAVIRRRDYDK